MRGWRTKIVVLLIVYFAGFATAIYCLAPVPEDKNFQSDEKSFTASVFKSDEFAKSFSVGIHKCIDLGKAAALRAGKLIKQKFEERKTDS